MDGTLDTTFNKTGKELFNPQPATWVVGFGDGGLQIGLAGDPQNAGKIVASAGADWTDHSYTSGVVRFNANGGVDTSFGTGGVAYTAAPLIAVGMNSPLAMVIQPDDKIIVGGQLNGGTIAAVERFTADGALDSSFGGSGNGLLTLARPEPIGSGPRLDSANRR